MSDERVLYQFSSRPSRGVLLGLAVKKGVLLLVVTASWACAVLYILLGTALAVVSTGGHPLAFGLGMWAAMWVVLVLIQDKLR